MSTAAAAAAAAADGDNISQATPSIVQQEPGPLQPSQESPDDAPQFECYYEMELPGWLLALAALVLAVAMATAGHLYRLEANHGADLKAAFGVEYPLDEHANPPMRSVHTSSADLIGRLGPANGRLFAQLDRDGNGLVSIVEYEALVHHVRQDGEHPVSRQVTADSIYPRCVPDGDSQCFRLRYHLTPPATSYLRYDPLSNGLATVANGSGDAAGKPAQEVAAALAEFAASGSIDDALVDVDPVTIATAFLPRMPAHLDQLRVGEPFPLIGPQPRGLHFYLAKQRRFHPGAHFEPAEVAMATLLRPLHPGLFLYPRHGGPPDLESAAAVLRAESPTHLELAFRLHPELQLAPFQALRSVYLTPPGLEGSLVLRRDGGGVEHFELAASAGHSFLESPHDIAETGQVLLPRLSISGGVAMATAATNWTAEVPMAEALRLLRARLLPHLAASFHGNVSAAIASNAEEARPIHVVLALGGAAQLGCDANCRALREFALTDPLVRLRLRHYYTNAWINFADAPGLADFQRLTGGAATAKPPLACHLLDPKTLRPLASFGPDQLRQALQAPTGLPSPLPPMPEALASGTAETRKPRRHGNLLASAESATTPEDLEDDMPDLETRHRLELQALDAVRRQVGDAYMQFLLSSKA